MAYRFDNEWHLRAPSEQVYAALADVERYELWWPQIREIHWIDADSGTVRVRSVLPYTLDLVLTRDAQDEAHGILRVLVAGDLHGWCAWRLTFRRNRHASRVQPGGRGHLAHAGTGAVRHPATAARQPRPHDAIR